ncbi:hypothetical protein IE81DRAFT_130787 [Ceraceosorus guamensis]|uniref:Uncharacterized protein n=1 Tax=Ceraceosorus guamensis TaxID=1522189 RepID=A0A316WDL2_9BASI|nr:hypothetical protein IE81DRAFT_130787 [Ceraceosorus guamensis]PWN45923.1 hypothetical protein IE81DRAFT_130787 [Ceraceosorus guamensis]
MRTSLRQGDVQNSLLPCGLFGFGRGQAPLNLGSSGCFRSPTRDAAGNARWNMRRRKVATASITISLEPRPVCESRRAAANPPTVGRGSSPDQATRVNNFDRSAPGRTRVKAHKAFLRRTEGVQPLGTKV